MNPRWPDYHDDRYWVRDSNRSGRSCAAPAVEQAALHGVIDRMQGLGLELVEVRTRRQGCAVPAHRAKWLPKATGVGAVADVYDFEITGTIGRMIACGRPGLSTVAESSWTVLAGTTAGPDDLRRLLDLLDAHGTPDLAVRITRRHDESAASPGGNG